MDAQTLVIFLIIATVGAVLWSRRQADTETPILVEDGPGLNSSHRQEIAR